jgi:hypothetical protein
MMPLDLSQEREESTASWSPASGVPSLATTRTHTYLSDARTAAGGDNFK